MATADQTIFDSATREEVREELDRLARELLDLTGDEFLRRWRGGQLPSSPTVDRVALLARLLTV